MTGIEGSIKPECGVSEQALQETLVAGLARLSQLLRVNCLYKVVDKLKWHL